MLPYISETLELQKEPRKGNKTIPDLQPGPFVNKNIYQEMKTLLHANKKYQTLFINSQKIYLLYPMYLKYFARDSIYLNL